MRVCARTRDDYTGVCVCVRSTSTNSSFIPTKTKLKQPRFIRIHFHVHTYIIETKTNTQENNAPPGLPSRKTAPLLKPTRYRPIRLPSTPYHDRISASQSIALSRPWPVSAFVAKIFSSASTTSMSRYTQRQLCKMRVPNQSASLAREPQAPFTRALRGHPPLLFCAWRDGAMRFGSGAS